MSMDVIWGIQKFTFGGQTYNGANGGPLDWDYSWEDNEIPSRVADQRTPSVIVRPEEDLEVSIAMRDIYTAITKGTKGDIVFTLVKDDSDETETLTFKNMKFLGQRAGGAKSSLAQATLRFRYEGDGVTMITRS